MSHIRVWLRLRGDFTELEKLAEAMVGLPFELHRQGDVYGDEKRPQPAHVLGLELGEWERGWPDNPEDERALLDDERRHFLAAAETVATLAEHLAARDRATCHGEVYIATIRYEDQGGFTLPEGLVAAAAAAGLAIDLSIAVLLGEEFGG